MPTLDKSIDVIIPVFNGAKYIAEAINSVDNQTLRPRTIIVVNDGSTDQTTNLVKKYQKQAKCKIILYSKNNGGLSSARNYGIKKSTAGLLAFLDADDLWLPTKLEKQLELFNKPSYKNLGVAFCDYEMIDENGKVDQSIPRSRLDQSSRGNIYTKLLEGNKVAGSGSGVLIKREVFQKVGYFDENLPAAEDWDMWLRIAREFDFDYVSQKLVQIRRHQTNMSNSEFRLLKGITLVLNKLVEMGIYSKKYLRSYSMRVIKLALCNPLDYHQTRYLVSVMSSKLKSKIWNNGSLLVDIFKAPVVLLLNKFRI